VLSSLEVHDYATNSKRHNYECKSYGVDIHGFSLTTQRSGSLIARHCGLLIKRSLGAPLQAGKIRILTFMRGPVRLEGLPLSPACFFLTLFLNPCFFALSLCESDFAWSSDGVLLVGASVRV
jgi:hypothetical protein